jgi:hypothetical protein
MYTNQNEIIDNYKPHPGFFDLSVKPKDLTKAKYAKVLNAQNFLAEQGKNIDYLAKFEPTRYEDLKEYSAMYQAIVFKYWEEVN